MTAINSKENTKKSLESIAECLHAGRAVLMVGSGFSKNADPSFLDWNELGHMLHERLYKEKLSSSIAVDVLKLAQEYCKQNKRGALDEFLKEQLYHPKIEPSDLHVKLLDLPWQKVFTTNYDTLLDDAGLKYSSREYSIIYTKEDIPRCKHPNIVKLHGSFPSAHSCIITKQDYDNYHKTHGAFERIAESEFMQNDLCLIGFSGNDPNFIKWNSWIIDNIGKDHAREIYLIGIFDHSEKEIRKFKDDNIIVVNLAKNVVSTSDDKKDNKNSIRSTTENPHYEALEKFFDDLQGHIEKLQAEEVKKKEDKQPNEKRHISAQQKPKTQADIDQDNWPQKRDCKPNNQEPKTQVEIIRNLITKWKTDRETYPGWVIVPQKKRELLWFYTRETLSYVSQLGDLPDLDDIRFLYELYWRLDKCLKPSLNDLDITVDNVLRKYRKRVYSSKNSELKKMWQYLAISLLRHYREENKLPEWQKWHRTITEYYKYLIPEHKAAFHYERVLHYLYIQDINNLKNSINEWKTNNALPMWECKKAAILAEIGKIDIAEKFLENTLNSITKQNEKTPPEKKYVCILQEIHALGLLLQINRFKKFNSVKNKKEPDKYLDRWNELKQYNYDPDHELDTFRLRLQSPPVYTPNVVNNKTFDIGRISRSIHLTNESGEALSAYEFLRYCEDAGIPFHIDNVIVGRDIAKDTLKRIYKNSPYYALAILIRTGNDKYVDEVLDRESLCSMSTREADSLINRYLKALRESKHILNGADTELSQRYAGRMACILPEILSRLCSRCSLDSKNKLLDFLLNLYKSRNIHWYSGVHNLLSRLLESYPSSQQVNIIPKLLAFPVPKNYDVVTATKFKNPLLFLDFDYIADKTKYKPDQKHLDNLFAEAASENPLRRKWATFTLVRLCEFGLLPKKCTVKLRNTLYSQRDDFGFPKNTDFYRFAFFKLPHPEGVNLEAGFKRYIQETPFPIQGNDNCYSFGYEADPFRELLNRPSEVKWKRAEINTIFDHLMECWDTDKNQLRKERGHGIMSIHHSFLERFILLAKVIAEFIVPNLKGQVGNDVKDKLERFIQDLDEYEVFSLRVKVAYVRISPNTKQGVIKDILNSLRSYDHDEVVYCLKAIYMVCDSQRNGFNKKDKTTLIWHIAQKICWRQQNGLSSALFIIAHILHNHDRLITPKAESLILEGLERLCKETDYKDGLALLDFYEKLEIRRAAVCLSYELHKWYLRNGADIPEVVLLWKGIAQSEGEFAEVKNQWLDL